MYKLDIIFWDDDWRFNYNEGLLEISYILAKWKGFNHPLDSKLKEKN